MSNPCVDACTAELDKAGVPYEVSATSKHVHIRYGAQKEHLHVVAATPSDWRAPLNERAQIRRELRSYGYVAQEAEPPSEIVPVSLVGGRPSCLSRDIARTFGKEHKNVLRDIDRIRAECGPEFDRLNFEPVDYLDERGRKYRAYRMTRDAFSLVVMGFTGALATAWKVRFIEAFNAMEAELARIAAPAVDMGAIRSEMDAIVAMVADVEARASLPAPAAPLQPFPYWLAMTRMERRKLARRLRRVAA